jgi:hypothetical protein
MVKAKEMICLLQEVSSGISVSSRSFFLVESSPTSVQCKSLLFQIISLAKKKLGQIFETDEYLSGDKIFDPSKDALALACIKSALLEISQKKLRLEAKLKELKVTLKESSGGQRQKMFQQHLKCLESVNLRLNDLIDETLESSGKSPGVDQAKVFEFLLDMIDEVENTTKSESYDLFSFYESEDTTLPWDQGAEAVKRAIDKKFKQSKQGMGGYLMMLYKHLSDTKKVAVMKQVLRSYEKRTLIDKKFAEKMAKDTSMEDVMGHRSFLRRHPMIAAHIGGPIFHKLAAITGVDGNKQKEGRNPEEEEGGEFQELGDSADLIGMYIAGRDYGNTEVAASGKRVGFIRKFYRRHPILSGVLLGKPLHGWIYHKGQQDGRAEDIHRALYPAVEP